MKRLSVIVLVSLLLALVITQAGYADTPPDVVLNSANGNYYQAVTVQDGLTWLDAKTAAAAATGVACPAHLVTITSSAEQAFVETLTLPYHPWIGASQADGAATPDAGWQWVTGEAWSYTHWADGEPNDDNGGVEDGQEQVAMLTDGNFWNDWPATQTNGGYIVEYECYTFRGFLAPITKSVNRGAPGRTYPIKWQLKDNDGQYISALSVVKSLTYARTGATCPGSDAGTPVAAKGPGRTILRYDRTANQYVFNWATPRTRGCYVLTLALDDGSTHSATFQLK
jgi:hypothetical protein